MSGVGPSHHCHWPPHCYGSCGFQLPGNQRRQHPVPLVASAQIAHVQEHTALAPRAEPQPPASRDRDSASTSLPQVSSHGGRQPSVTPQHTTLVLWSLILETPPEKDGGAAPGVPPRQRWTANSTPATQRCQTKAKRAATRLAYNRPAPYDDRCHWLLRCPCSRWGVRQPCP